MSNNNENQEETRENFYLYELQPQLIEAKSTLEKVLKKLCSEDMVMELISETSGDSSTTIIWHVQEVIKYLKIIITNNQSLINALMLGKS